jgi:hypothetical protein
MSTLTLGVAPGANCGIALIGDHDEPLLLLSPKADAEHYRHALTQCQEIAASHHARLIAALEESHRVTQVIAPLSHLQSLSRWEGLLAGAGVPHRIFDGEWRHALGGVEPIEIAQRRCAAAGITARDMRVADALCLAWWARRTDSPNSEAA